MGIHGMPPLGYQPYPPYPQYPPGAAFPPQGYPPQGIRGAGKYPPDGRDTRRMGPGPDQMQGDSGRSGRDDEGEGARGDGSELKFGKFVPPTDDETGDKGQERNVSASNAQPSAPAAAIVVSDAKTAPAAGPVATKPTTPATTSAPIPAPNGLPMTFAEKAAAAMHAPAPVAAAPSHQADPVKHDDTHDKPKSRSFSPRNNASNSDTTATEASEWSRDTKSKDGSTPPGFGSARNGGAAPSSPVSGGGGGWKRGEAIQAESLALRDDGVKRYTKATLIGLYSTKKVCPDAISEQYLSLAKIERQPVISSKNAGSGGSGTGSGGTGGGKFPRSKSGHIVEEPHPDEQIIFAKDKEGTFRYQPSRLSDTTDPAVILIKANLILNKLSMTKFDKLSDEFMAVGLDSEELMGKAVEMIVQKAQIEEHFCFMYADLCRKITDQWSSGSAENEESLGKSFRVKLLDFCRAEFGRNRIAELEEIRKLEIPQEDKDEKEILLKKRYTGTMRFIGELYMKSMVSSGVMQNCVIELLQAQEEETLVCMCKLLRTIGYKLQTNDTKKKTDVMGDYFEKIAKMSLEHPSCRMRFMLKDLIDMRIAGWVERRETEKAVKLSELRADEQQQHGGKGGQARSSSSSSLSHTNGGTQDARGPRHQQDAAAPDGWHTVPVGKSKSKPSAAPSAFGSASQSKPNVFGSGKAGTTTNAFSALSAKQSAVPKRDMGRDRIARVRPDRKAGTAVDASGLIRTESPAFSDAPDDEIGLDRSISYGMSENGDGSDRGSSPRCEGQAGAGGSPVEKSVIEQVKKMVANYFLMVDKDDTADSISNVVHPDGMGDVIKPCIMMAFDKRDADRQNFILLLVHLHAQGILRTEQVARGLSAFLDDLDEIVIDVPMVVRQSAFSFL